MPRRLDFRLLLFLSVDIETGTLYVVDWTGAATGLLYRVPPRGKATLIADTKSCPVLKAPVAIAMDGQSHLIIPDGESGDLYRFKLADRSTEKIAGDQIGRASCREREERAAQ